MPARAVCLSFTLVATAIGQWLTVDQRRPTPVFSAREMLAVHNQIRARVDVPPLRWSATLAVRAQDWARHLLRQSQFYHRANSDFGENLFEITGCPCLT